MKVYTSLEHLSEIAEPVFLTIGNFDGVHLGHQTLLKNLQEGAKKEQLPSVVITFNNHPSTILRPNHPIPKLTSKEQKIEILELIGIDYVFMLDFTLSFSHQSAEMFLRKVYSLCPFRRLILGSNAKLGNDRQGNTPLMHQLARDLHYTLDFLPLEASHQTSISSSRIRTAIQNAELTVANELLGRKYAICGEVVQGQGKGSTLGFPTLNIAVNDLCIPPLGVYAVTVQNHPGVANIGIAPTVRHDHIPILEVYLLDHHMNLYGQTVEVIFEEFFRPEQTFASIDDLKAQITADVEQAKTYFKLE
jgi:riboflavin kinase/FMN adenylyltransferase